MEILSVCKGVIGNSGIPESLANMIYYIYTAIKVVIPILLIIFGSIDLGKAITAGKEDEIKKAQSGFIKKLIVGVLVFLIFTIVQFVAGFADSNVDMGSEQDTTVGGCINQILNHKH